MRESYGYLGFIIQGLSRQIVIINQCVAILRIKVINYTEVVRVF